MTSGPQNPTIALELLIWNAGAYNDPDPHKHKETIFMANNYGRFIWLYILAPLVAALFAGPLARIHCDELNNDLDKS